jgi:hypothetical protein
MRDFDTVIVQTTTKPDYCQLFSVFQPINASRHSGGPAHLRLTEQEQAAVLIRTVIVRKSVRRVIAARSPLAARRWQTSVLN